MKKLFIHNAFFRLIAPVFVGGVVYLLILLINNNVGQIKEAFFGEELYLCIVLAYIVQELNRLSLLVFKTIKFNSFLVELSIRFMASLLATSMIVWCVIHYYFKWRLGYAANSTEISMFIIIYGTIAVIYLILYYGHFMLFRINESLLIKEEEIKEHLQHDFFSYTRDINPELLYDGLENIIVALRNKDIDQVDEIVDKLSFLYRYILARREKELVPFDSEYAAIENLIELVNKFQTRNISLEVKSINHVMVIPSSMISIIDFLIRGCVPAPNYNCCLAIGTRDSKIEIRLNYIGRILENNDPLLQYWMDRYRIFTDGVWEIDRNEYSVRVAIPIPMPVKTDLIA